MVYYKQVKVTINTPGLAEVIINIVLWHYCFSNSMVGNCSWIFISKLWFLISYFLRIAQRLSRAFHFQTNSRTKMQNSIMDAYLCFFTNYKQNNWAKLILMVEFANNNMKNVNISHILFELNCSFHPHVSYSERCRSTLQIQIYRKACISILRMNNSILGKFPLRSRTAGKNSR